MSIAISDTMQLNLAANYNELVRMINQRRAAMSHYSDVGPLPATEVAAGDECRAWNIIALQEIVEDLATHCVLSSDLSGKSNFWLGNKQVFFDSIYGSGKSGFWRRATSPSSIQGWDNNYYNSPGYSYGKFEVGDIVGPWIFFDLQTAILKINTFWVSAFGFVSDCNHAYDARNYSDSTSWDSQSTEVRSELFAQYVANGGTYVIPLDRSLAPAGNVTLINLLPGSKSFAVSALAYKPSGWGPYTYEYFDFSGRSVAELSTRVFSLGSTSSTSFTFASPFTPKSFSTINAQNQVNKVRGQHIFTLFYVTHTFT